MLKYIYRDLVSVLRYLPYGLMLGIPAAAVSLIFDRRKREKNEALPKGTVSKGAVSKGAVSKAVFVLYMAVLLVITFLSRESGSNAGTADLELFSTWGINTRNNAYVVENVLLFIPWGITCCMAFPAAGRFFPCVFLGALTSVMIECLQLVTGRGVFQVDDIMTNILGAAGGCILYWAAVWLFRRRKTGKS